jgi:hypothetical protein
MLDFPELKQSARSSPRQPLISRATKAGLIAEKGAIGNAYRACCGAVSESSLAVHNGSIIHKS